MNACPTIIKNKCIYCGTLYGRPAWVEETIESNRQFCSMRCERNFLFLPPADQAKRRAQLSPENDQRE